MLREVINECWYKQALAGEVGMSNELDNVARSLNNGHIPHIWRRLAPATLKTLGNWMIHFQERYDQYNQWVMSLFCRRQHTFHACKYASKTVIITNVHLT